MLSGTPRHTAAGCGEAIASEVASLVRPDAAARQVELDVHVPGDLPQIRGDRVHLQQVLLNLMLNGMDAQNGARLEDRRVSITARPDGAPIASRSP